MLSLCLLGLGYSVEQTNHASMPVIKEIKHSSTLHATNLIAQQTAALKSHSLHHKTKLASGTLQTHRALAGGDGEDKREAMEPGEYYVYVYVYVYMCVCVSVYGHTHILS
ncbi:hypothetical protein EON63_13135 [archaeon]|nr:MAG: hypothetical protein EON63_13135 [archaeon]